MVDSEFSYYAQLGYTGTIADKRNAYYTDQLTGAGSDLPSGAKAQTFSRRGTTTASAGTSGRLVLSLIYLRAGTVVNAITFGSGSTALATPSNGWAALYNADRTLVAQTPDDTGITWAANSEKVFTFSTPITISTAAFYYVGYCIVASTMPTVVCISNTVFTTKAPAVGGWSTTGLTTTAPATAAALSAAPYPYAYIT